MSTVKEKIITALTLFWDKAQSLLIRKANIVDNCASTSTDYPLSANQGTQLQTQIDELNTKIPTIQSGTESFTVASGEDPQVKIMFPTAFTNAPLISLEYKNYGSWIRLSNTSVNKYGITFNAKNTYSGDLTFSILWQAIGV